MTTKVASRLCAISVVLLAAACGEPDSVGNANRATTATSVDISAAAVTTSPAVGIDATTAVVEPPAWRPERVGPITVAVPEQATDDLRDLGSSPPFVVDVHRWIIADCCLLAVVVQSEAPLFPDDERRETFDAPGVTWTMYDTGPRDGTSLTAVAGIEGTWVLVGAQSLARTAPPDMPTVVREVASSAEVSP